jgi:cyclopropane fatty-acyl-phospholipid synthase-like methyltransferase
MTDSQLGSTQSVSPGKEVVDLYGAQYGHFAEDAYAAIRREAFGEDIGQNGWTTAEEQDRFAAWLGVGPGDRVLDVACGAGGPARRLAKRTGCGVLGIDIHEQGIARARELATQEGLADRAAFEHIDASGPLPLSDASFDAVVCIDAINHLPNRLLTLTEWARVLKPGGRVLFTDPITVTGPLSNAEIAIRSSIAFFLFVPPGYDEQVLHETGFAHVVVEDRTENTATLASRWHAARAARADVLRRVEGNETYEGQQTFLDVCARLARERRLSRFVYVATKDRAVATPST